MAVTEQTRTGLIGLSVAMLGTAPGATKLGTWVQAINDQDLDLGDVAAQIVRSPEFQSAYPAFLTNTEFAGKFLGNNLAGLVSDKDLADLTALPPACSTAA